MRRVEWLGPALLCAAALASATSARGSPDEQQARAQPAPAALISDIAPESFATGVVPGTPYATTAFHRPSNAGPSAQKISGRLSFDGARMTHFRVIRDEFDYVADSSSIATLPPFSIELLQVGDALVPLSRTAHASAHPDWEWIFSPGVVWADGSAGNRSHAVLPFALVERNANCTHNGLARFRLDADGTVSQLVYQIGSETCAYTQFDAWGAAPIRFVAGEPETPAGQAQAYVRELRDRMTSRPIEALPEVLRSGLGSPEEVRPSAMTLFGFVADDVHYVSDCQTRYGPYGYCDTLVLPSYSWAKSVVAGIAAMRLERLYPGAMQSKISDHVPECAGPGWRDVTFANALSMATGHYNAPGHEVDEQSSDMRRFFLAESHSEKIRIACTAFARRHAPGKKFVYRTGDTYILGTAINAYLRRATGDDTADFYNDLLEPIWNAIGLSPLARSTRRTYDTVRQPFSGWGIWLYRSDIAALASFLHRGGTVAGQALLDKAMLEAALQRDPDRRGLRAVVDSQRYQHGFWAWNAGPAIGCRADLWIPAMSGFGGLSAALMPNGSTYYYVSDGGDFAWRRAAQASNRFRPFCKEITR